MAIIQIAGIQKKVANKVNDFLSERVPSSLSVDIENPMTAELIRLEKVIDEGIVGYYSIGEALSIIQSKKLYKAYGIDSFKEYCEKRFSISRSHGYRMIAYCKVYDLLGEETKHKIPERQIRLLSSIPQNDIQEVWREAKRESGSTRTYPQLAVLKQVLKRKKDTIRDEKIRIIESECGDEQEFYCHALFKKIKLNSIENKVNYIINASGKNVDKLNRIFTAFIPHYEFCPEELHALKMKIIEWQMAPLNTFAEVAGIVITPDDFCL